MILSFKDKFVEKILSGEKIHTIREDKHHRWKPGNKIHFATGIRTKNYKQFFEGECKSVQRIIIKCVWDVCPNVTVFIDGKELKAEQLISLVKNDGFNTYNFMGLNLQDFFEFFFPVMGKDKIYVGIIIHWTDFKY